MNIPPDDNGNNTINPGLGFDPNAPLPPEMSLSKKGSKMPLIIVGVLLAGGGGFLAYSAKKTHAERTVHAKFMEEFRDFEKEELGKFWSCAIGPNADGTTIAVPDQITTKVDQNFASDFRNYPTRVREECAQKAKDAATKANALMMLPAYTAPIDAYGKSIIAMSDGLEEWSKAAPEQVQTKMVGKNVDEYGNAWHSFAGGAPSPEVIAYDQFLHCAVPDADTKYKDSLELATKIHDSCKDTKYRDKLQEECGKLVTDKPAQPTKSWKTAQQKFGPDDETRELSAIADCLKKARKAKLKDNLSPVGLLWVKFREAREVVLKVGADALKE